MPEKIGTIYNDDKTGQRTGWILEESVNNTIMKGVQEARDYINIKKVDEKKPMKHKELFDMIDLLKAGVMIAYPCYYGLPEWEPCKLLIEDKEDLLNKEIPNFDVRLLFNFSILKLIILFYGMPEKNMREANIYVTILERMRRLRLFVDLLGKVLEHL